MLGSSSWKEFAELTYRLAHAVTDGEPLTDLDWPLELGMVAKRFGLSLGGSNHGAGVCAAALQVRGGQPKQPRNQREKFDGLEKPSICAVSVNV